MVACKSATCVAILPAVLVRVCLPGAHDLIEMCAEEEYLIDDGQALRCAAPFPSLLALCQRHYKFRISGTKRTGTRETTQSSGTRPWTWSEFSQWNGGKALSATYLIC